MFTGIVEEMGEVVSLEEKDDMVLWDGSTGSGTELTVKGNIALESCCSFLNSTIDFLNASSALA